MSSSGALGALEEEALAVVDPAVQELLGVAQAGAEALGPDPALVGVDGGRGSGSAPSRLELDLDAGELARAGALRGRGPKRSHHAQAEAGGLALVGRADAARGGADLAGAARPPRGPCRARVAGQQRRGRGWRRRAGRRSARRPRRGGPSSESMASGATTMPLPRTQTHVRVQDARGDQLEGEVAVAELAPCGRRCGRPGSAPRRRRPGRGDRRSSPCPRPPTAFRR